MGDLNPTWFLEPTQFHNPNSISTGSAIFAGLTIVTDRQRDNPTRSVTTGCIYERSTATRTNNKHDNNMLTSITL